MTGMEPICEQPLWHQQKGDGPPVLLLHGLGASSHYWDAVLERLGGFRAIAPDLLGFGRSPAPSEASYDVGCHLAALRPLLREKTVVVGHSTGSMLAGALARAHPELVKGLVLVSLPAYPDEETARREIGRIGLLAKLTVEGRFSARVVCEVMCHLRPLAIAASSVLIRDMPRQVAADGARHTWPSYSRTLHEVVAGHPVLPDLRSLECPISLLHARGDQVAPIEYVETIASEVKATEFRQVDGDHHLPVRHPALVADFIRRAAGTG